jgi:hypothetical protein
MPRKFDFSMADDLIKIPTTSQNQSFLNLVNALGIDLEKGPFLAGGAARRVLQNEKLGYNKLSDVPNNGDIDIFFKNDEQMKESCLSLIDKYELETLEVTDNAVTYRIRYEDLYYNLQFIYKYYPSTVKELFDSFDLTVCQIALCSEYILITEQALKDLENRILRFNSKRPVTYDNYPERILKYIEYGFTPDNGIVTTVLKEVSRTTAHARPEVDIFLNIRRRPRY